MLPNWLTWLPLGSQSRLRCPLFWPWRFYSQSDSWHQFGDQSWEWNSINFIQWLKKKKKNGEAGIYFKNQLCNIFWVERHQVCGRVEVNLRDLERVGVIVMSYSRTGVRFRPETDTVLLYSSYMGFPNYCHGNCQLSQIWWVCRLTC